MSDAAKGGTEVHYAGFWRRAVATFIDGIVVSVFVFLAFVLAAFLVPGIAQMVDAGETGWLTVSQTLETKPSITSGAGDDEKVVTEKIVQNTVAGTWVYLYKVVETVTVDKFNTDTPKKKKTESASTRLDPATRNEISSMSLSSLEWLPWIIYVTLMEASRWQATLGKMVLGIKVTDQSGNRLSLPRAFARNGLKVLSVLTLMIGFMMAGWTRRKQALHDKMTDCYVTAGEW